MPTSPIATFINHDLHNKFGVLRNATGMLEMILEKLPEVEREKVEKQALLINQTLDRLSQSVINYTDCLKLEYLTEQEQSIDINYEFEKLINELKGKGWVIQSDKSFETMVMNEEVFSYIIKTIVETINSLNTEPVLEIKKSDQHEIIFAFKDVAEDRSSYKNIRELLNGKLKPEALPHFFNLFFANYLLNKKNGNIQLEYLEPGTMGFHLKLGKNN
jgi:hypothetical protein